jgi:hypothetical protein
MAPTPTTTDTPTATETPTETPTATDTPTDTPTDIPSCEIQSFSIQAPDTVMQDLGFELQAVLVSTGCADISQWSFTWSVDPGGPLIQTGRILDFLPFAFAPRTYTFEVWASPPMGSANSPVVAQWDVTVL